MTVISHSVNWFQQRTVHSVAQLRAAVLELTERTESKNRQPPFIYRGQKAAWPLSTSLERACKNLGSSLTDASELERRCVREFQRRAHHYVPAVPGPSHKLEWFALMQHHGAPTRLLDWSYSLEIATFFALRDILDDPEADGAVWMMNDTWCKTRALDLLGKVRKREDIEFLDRPIEYKDEPRLTRILMSEPVVAFLFPLSPFRLNERLTLQKGLFLITGDVSRTFEENLRAMEDCPLATNLMKFVLPGDCRAEIAEDLFDLNVTDATLFPGLDGFARSLKMTLRFLERRRKIWPTG